MQVQIVKNRRGTYTTVTVPSQTNPSKQYTVDVVNQRCSCPAWIYQKGPQSQRTPCKHLRALGFKVASVQEELPNVHSFEEAL